MPYIIRYGNDRDLERFTRKDGSDWGIVIFAFLAALIVGIRVFCPELFTAGAELLIPWDDTTAAAFSIMVENVHGGQPVMDAVEAFCRSVLNNASLGY